MIAMDWKKELHLRVAGGLKDAKGKKAPKHFSVSLEHSCDEWQIGTIDDGKELAHALERIWEVATRLEKNGKLRELHLGDDVAWWIDNSPLKETK